MNQELIEYKEQVASEELTELSQNMAVLSAKQAYNQLIQTSDVPFTPVEDAKKLENIIDAVSAKIDKLTALNIDEEVRKSLTRHVTVEDENGERQVEVVPDDGWFLTITEAEKTVASTLKTYTDILTKAMKEKRLLSGQLYGSQVQQGAYIPRIVSMRKAMFTNPNLNDNHGPVHIHEIAPTPHIEAPKPEPQASTTTVADLLNIKANGIVETVHNAASPIPSVLKMDL